MPAGTGPRRPGRAEAEYRAGAPARARTWRLWWPDVLWLLYVRYLGVRRGIASPERRAMVAAVYGVIAFLDVPLVWLSVKLLPDVHPEKILSRGAAGTGASGVGRGLGLLGAGAVGVMVCGRRGQIGRRAARHACPAAAAPAPCP
jgi:heme exporter protein C